MEINTPYVLPESSFELLILTENHNIKIESIELIEPYEVSDKYTPNRHGIVFKELIYVRFYSNYRFQNMFM